MVPMHTHATILWRAPSQVASPANFRRCVWTSNFPLIGNWELVVR